MHICNLCGTYLDEFNWYMSSQKNRDYICKKCCQVRNKKAKDEWRLKNNTYNKEYSKEYYLKNRAKMIERSTRYWIENKDKVNERNRKHARKTTLNTNGKIHRGLQKRDYTDVCEVCGSNAKLLQYHHWDDNNLNIGIWVCVQCHKLVEFVENDTILLVDKYLKLKTELTPVEMVC